MTDGERVLYACTCIAVLLRYSIICVRYFRNRHVAEGAPCTPQELNEQGEVELIVVESELLDGGTRLKLTDGRHQFSLTLR